ncbi:MAG: Glycosyltransferase [Parcubacteria group bacterium GW2011_GWA1_47_10]|nr:MAG: Glycosyltransferase [Parcubacteria group bacterium GW2011_GWA1_47_10]
MTKRTLIVTGIFPPDSGGPASYAQALASRLSSAGQKVSVLTYADRWRLGGQSYQVVTVWRGWPRLWRHFLYFIKTLKLARSADKILALSAVNAGIVAVLAGRWLKKPVVIRIGGDYAWERAVNQGKTQLLINDFQTSPKHGTIYWLDRIQRWTCRQARRVIAQSNFQAELIKGWGVPAERVEVIYNGVDWTPADISQEEARKQINIAGNIIFSFGRLVPWKGNKMLIKLMPRLLRLNQFLRLVIAGDGPELATLQKMVKNLRLDKKVYLVGKQSKPELGIYLAAASLFVQNTAYEGFSHQILEAMASGVPVVTTRIAANRELVQQGENGFMVNYNDEFNLYEAIKTAWGSPELRERFIANGKKTVARFTVDEMYKKTAQLLSDLK